MKTPSLEEVKQKYLNAKEVRCNEYLKKEDNKIFEIDIDSIYELSTRQIVCKDAKRSTPYVSLFYRGQYAEILSYKEKTYQLPETFVKELCKEPNIKEAFIREGIIENDKLEAGKWYKDSNPNYKGLIYIEKWNGCKDGITGYGFGFNSGNFKQSHSDWCVGINSKKCLVLATPQEVETALIDEAKKRGYENLKHNCLVASNLKINNPCKEYIYRKNKLWIGTEENANCIFHNGVWAEIIDETIEIKKSIILNTPNDLELGKLIRKMV